MNKCKNCGNDTLGKYCNNKCQASYERNIKIKDFLAGKYAGKKMLYAKDRWNRVFLGEHFGEKCACCGISDWNGKPITLEVNHIDGSSFNNIIENLELLCPNCHSQTNTYRNKGSRISDNREYRRLYS